MILKNYHHIHHLRHFRRPRPNSNNLDLDLFDPSLVNRSYYYNLAWGY
jgi:hypothetical protein